MPIALTPNEKWDYVLKDDRKLPPEKQTVFKLRALTADEYFLIQNYQFNTSEGYGIGQANRTTLVAGLVGWDNFKDDHGKIIVFEKENDMCSPRNLDYLKPAHLMELVNAIRRRNKVEEEEEKN